MFVSSTLEELAPERDAAREAIETLRFIPVLFESGARPHPPRALYRAYLEQCHVFVGVYWQRYGWVAPGAEVSGIEDEYELAVGLPKLVYVKRPTGEREPRLQAMLRRVAEGGLSYRRFESADELARLLRDDLAVLVSARFAPAPPVERRAQVSIPTPASSFIGREHDLASVEDLIRRPDVRLVTLTGPGGIGKTRLAFEAARRAADSFMDGVVTVLLADLHDSVDVVPRIAEAVGVSDVADTSPLEALQAHLSARQLLLVLDNMEHVLAAAPAVGDLLAAAPELSVLATSRARLDITGEHRVQVPPLGVPAADERELEVLVQSDAVRLFTARAEAAGWKTAEADAPIVAEVVRRLEGLPLAIELAAAQARLVPAELIHTRLRRRLDLGGGPRDAEERHRTLRNTIAWSYDLLDEPARRFFETLSVFSGGFTIDAAGAVGESDENVFELLGSLVDSSLVKIEPSRTAGVRFGMLDTISEYSAERLDERGEREAAAARHVAYFAAVADEAYDAPVDKRRLTRLRLDEERENLRAALEEALRTSPADGVRLAGDLEHLWSFRGLAHTGRDTIMRALSAAPDAPAAWRARALLAGAWLAAEQGDYDQADRWALEALQLFRALGDTRHVGESLHALGWSAEGRGDPEQAVRYFEDSYRALAKLSDESLQLDTVISLAKRLALHGELDEAQRLYTQALEYFQLHGLDDERAFVLIHLGIIDERRGNVTLARNSYESSVAIVRPIENPRLLAGALVRLGHLDAGAGRIEDAARSYAEALDLHLGIGDRPGVAFCLEGAARIALSRDRADPAARLLGAARAIRDASAVRPPSFEAPSVAETESEAQETLGEEYLAAAAAEGASYDLA